MAGQGDANGVQPPCTYFTRNPPVREGRIVGEACLRYPCGEDEMVEGVERLRPAGQKALHDEAHGLLQPADPAAIARDAYVRNLVAERLRSPNPSLVSVFRQACSLACPQRRCLRRSTCAPCTRLFGRDDAARRSRRSFVASHTGITSSPELGTLSSPQKMHVMRSGCLGNYWGVLGCEPGCGRSRTGAWICGPCVVGGSDGVPSEFAR